MKKWKHLFVYLRTEGILIFDHAKLLAIKVNNETKFTIGVISMIIYF